VLGSVVVAAKTAPPPTPPPRTGVIELITLYLTYIIN
jgi:hypothetical protein